jgi:HlyD family secretion protein
VVIQVDNSDLKLKPGMTANVSIIIATKKDVLKIPNAALRFKIDEKEKRTTEKKAGGSGLWILQQGRPKRINISAGISDGSYTEITSDTLHEGQEVILESILKDQKKQASPPGPRFF